MIVKRKSYLWLGALSCFFITLFGFWIILVPNNPITKLFRAPISDTHQRVVTGPYPARSDFRVLYDDGVTAIVSLLDPKIPYERVLLDQESANAKRYGMKFFDFPMASILGQRMGDYYDRDAQLAARTIDSLYGDKVYLHCYLGVHRMTVVREILRNQGILKATYTERNQTLSNRIESARFPTPFALY
jgi:hypothetical protein